VQPVLAQYVAGAIVLVGIFIVLSDPEGSANIINAFGYAGASQIGALQGRAVGEPSKLASRRK